MSRRTSMESESQENKFWDSFAGRYDSFMKRTQRTYDRIIQKIITRVNTSDQVFEVAAGTGIISLAVAPHVKSVCGSDISPEMIKVAESKRAAMNIGNVEFSLSNAYDLPYEDESFDVAIASNVLHVMVSPEKALASVHRVLKPEGLLIAPTYCHGSSVVSRAVSLLMSLSGFRACHRWSEHSLRDFLESENYEIVEYEVIPDVIPLVYVVARKRVR
ncbi:MAG TPA: methyltransferase domain-containing protein [Spirochaetota bacterium]|nr:methyltransferase domain-containing protein [Spirochaetota bacterium]HQO01861.1 methyltransferase domain-containing protein [Spirochaetota bacterium]HQP47875.1 methyltransferase domain-containing protein [Spirochaetota bacterium]